MTVPVRIAPRANSQLRRVKSGKKPFTIVNIKPYWLILRGNRIICEGETGFPYIFDTKPLADHFRKINAMKGCRLVKVELEDILYACRSDRFHFDSIILIDCIEQID